MLLNLSDLSSEPLQSQIIRQVRAQVLIGSLKAGSQLPSIRALAREQRVSVITVQRAYEHLERESLIVSRRGKGFYVNEIEAKEKKKMAKEKLQQYLRGPILAALEEGLSETEIRQALEKVIESQTQT